VTVVAKSPQQPEIEGGQATARAEADMRIRQSKAAQSTAHVREGQRFQLMADVRHGSSCRRISKTLLMLHR